MTTAVQVRERGVVTLPAGLRRKYGIKVGDTFQILDLDGLADGAPGSRIGP